MPTSPISSSTPFLGTESPYDGHSVLCQDCHGQQERLESRLSLKHAFQRNREALVLLTTLVFGILVGSLSRQMMCSARLAMHENETAPIISTGKMVFLEDSAYTQSASDVSNSAWESLIPQGRGFVKVIDNDSGNERHYCVSVFHQLHCLDMLRRGYYAAAGSERETATTAHHSHATSAAHMRHCFDYIRQALMCAADSTLEEKNETIGGVRGWGTVHRCRDFQALKKWTSEHRYNEEGGIVN